MSILSLFRRKTIKELNVRVFEEDQEVNIEKYTDFHLTEIKMAIESVLNKKKGYFWFEVNVYEECGFFKKSKTCIKVEFMKESQNSVLGKKRISIPYDFMDSLKAKKITIEPKKILVKGWPKNLSVELY